MTDGSGYVGCLWVPVAARHSGPHSAGISAARRHDTEIETASCPNLTVDATYYSQSPRRYATAGLYRAGLLDQVASMPTSSPRSPSTERAGGLTLGTTDDDAAL